MQVEEDALRLRVYLGETDRAPGHGNELLYKRVVHSLRARGVWGATVIRGIYGFGKRSRLHAASPLRLSGDLPVIVEAVDRESKIRAVLQELREQVADGLITLDRVTVVTGVSGIASPDGDDPNDDTP